MAHQTQVPDDGDEVVFNDGQTGIVASADSDSITFLGDDTWQIETVVVENDDEDVPDEEFTDVQVEWDAKNSRWKELGG